MKNNQPSIRFMQMLAVVTVAFSAAIYTPAQELSQPFTCLSGVIIKLPAGWKRIERQVLDESFDEVIGAVPNAGLVKEQAATGFQLESNQPGIGFPRIIVITNKLGKLSDQYLKELLPSLRKTQTATDAVLAGNTLKTSAKVSDVSYDDQHHFLRVVAVVSVPESVTLHVVSIMFATESGMVTFHFTSTEEQYQRFSPLLSKVIKGIQVFRPEFPLPPRDPQARKTNKVYWTPKYGLMRWMGNGWLPPDSVD